MLALVLAAICLAGWLRERVERKRAQQLSGTLSFEQGTRDVSPSRGPPHPSASLVWLARAVRECPNSREFRAALHNVMLGTPRLLQLFAPDASWRRESIARVCFATMNDSGDRAATVCESSGPRGVRQQVDLWETTRGMRIGQPLMAIVASDTDSGSISLRFSQDGRRLAAACHDGTLRIFNAADGTLLAGPIRMKAPCTSARFSADGRRVVTTSKHGVAVWDAIVGRRLTPFMEMGADADFASFSADGRWVLALARNKLARVFDASNGRSLTDDLHIGALRTSFSADGKRMVGNQSSQVQVWDTFSGKVLTRFGGDDRADGSIDMMHRIRGSYHFSPDGRRVAIVADRGDVETFATRSGERQTDIATQRAPYEAGFSPNGRDIVGTWLNGDVVLWNAESGDAIASWNLGAPLGEQAMMNAIDLGGVITMAPGGERALTVRFDAPLAQLWGLRTRRGVRVDCGGPIETVAFGPDGRRVITASDDGLARVYDALSGESACVPLQHAAWVLCAALTDDDRAITVDADGNARVWNIPGGTVAYAWALGTGRLHGAEFQAPHALGRSGAPGARLVTQSADLTTLRVWDVATRRACGPAIVGDRPFRTFALSADGSRMVTGSGDFDKWEATRGGSRCQIWQVASGQPCGPPLHLSDAIAVVAFSPDGRYVAAAGDTGTMQVWDATNGEPQCAPMMNSFEVNSLSFNADGSRLVAACGGGYRATSGQIAIWDARSGRLVTDLPQEHAARVAAFSPDGRWVASGSRDGTVRVWETDSGQPLSGALRGRGPVMDLKFSPNGRLLMASDRAHTVHVWPVAGDDDEPVSLAEIEAELWSGMALDRQLRCQPLDGATYADLCARWRESAARHATVCAYPESNLWRTLQVP